MHEYRYIIIDADVADLYGIEKKQVNQAVKNNPEKFLNGYLFELDTNDKNEPVKNFDRFKKLKHSSATLKGFTEKGLYPNNFKMHRSLYVGAALVAVRRRTGARPASTTQYHL